LQNQEEIVRVVNQDYENGHGRLQQVLEFVAAKTKVEEEIQEKEKEIKEKEEKIGEQGKHAKTTLVQMAKKQVSEDVEMEDAGEKKPISDVGEKKPKTESSLQTFWNNNLQPLFPNFSQNQNQKLQNQSDKEEEKIPCGSSLVEEKMPCGSSLVEEKDQQSQFKVRGNDREELKEPSGTYKSSSFRNQSSTSRSPPNSGPLPIERLVFMVTFNQGDGVCLDNTCRATSTLREFLVKVFENCY
jgi:hypothetical protein